MRFRRPFDSVQRAAAARMYRSYRKNLKALRADYPPKTIEEQERFRLYHDLLQDFAREAAKEDVKVDFRRLNELDEQITKAAIAYLIARMERKVDETD